MENYPSIDLLTNVSEIELVYKRKVECKNYERPVILSSSDSFHLLNFYWNQGKMDLLEEFRVLYLDRGHRVKYIYLASQGGLSGTVADPRLILAAGIKVAAVSMILAHNHPSGGLKPSRADEELTQKIKEAARYFDIKVLDHIIMTSEGYMSFADEGLL